MFTKRYKIKNRRIIIFLISQGQRNTSEFLCKRIKLCVFVLECQISNKEASQPHPICAGAVGLWLLLKKCDRVQHHSHRKVWLQKNFGYRKCWLKKSEWLTLPHIIILNHQQVHLPFLGTGAEDTHLGLLAGISSYLFFPCKVVSCFQAVPGNFQSMTGSLEEAVETAICLLSSALLWI